MEILCKLKNGDVIERYDNAVVARFSGARNVLSTAPICGGYTEQLKYIFNKDCRTGSKNNCGMTAPTYAEMAANTAAELGLDPKFASGFLTAAQMENVSIKELTYRDVTVTAVVTGGIDVNGGRVGDPAQWHETEGRFTPVLGTINIMLFISASLTSGALARSLVTCTEAKTAAVGELLAPSCYSDGIATGSGTDGTMVVCDPAASTHLTDAGKHSKLGELIGKTVMPAVKEALYLQTGICPKAQHSVEARLGRFGTFTGTDTARWREFSESGENTVAAAMLAHLLDEVGWGMLDMAELKGELSRLAVSMGLDGGKLSFESRDAFIASLFSEINKKTGGR